MTGRGCWAPIAKKSGDICATVPRLGSAPLSRRNSGIAGSADEKEVVSNVVMPSSS